MKSSRTLPKLTSTLGGLLALAALITQSQAAFVSYYVGVDGRATVPSGTYNGLANPNHNRLTFLYAHTYPENPTINHYHSKGVLVHTGPNLGAGTATTVSSSNFLPEGSAPPLLMQAGSGAYAGKLVNVPTVGNPFSFLTIEDTGKIAGFAAGSPEDILFNSSGGRWNGSLAGADVHMKLISATAGLFFGSASDPTANPFASPDGVHLEDEFSFSLHPWLNAGAAPGVYTAQFQLEDESGMLGESGTFEFRFAVIPEPSSAALATLAAAAITLRRRRNS
jgi:MYXO-CTERM domain-containing protein